MGDLIYIRKLFTQDLRDGKQIAFPRDPAGKFFNFKYWLDGIQPRQISFTFIPKDSNLSLFANQIIKTRLYAAGTKEARIDGEVKAFLRDELHAKVNDYVEFRKLDDNSYTFDFISQESDRSSFYENFCESRGFHTLVMPHAEESEFARLDNPSRHPTTYCVPEEGQHRLQDEALKVFAEKRSSSQSGNGKTYDESCAETRAEAAKIDGDYLVRCDYDAFRKTLNSVQVANSFFSKHTEDDKRRMGDFIAAVRQDPRDISFYLAENRVNVLGVGPAMLTAFLTRTRPDLFVFFTDQMFESVKFLGLTGDAVLPQLTTDSYNTYKGIQTAIRDRMREMGIKAENGGDADYLTVNEFTWFVSEYQDLIKERAMSAMYKKTEIKKVPQTKITDFSDFIKKLEGDVTSAGFKYAPRLMKRFVCAQLAKPFVVLTGLSGSGKTKLAQAFPEWIAVENTSLVVPVGADWTNSERLLGFPNALDPDNYVLPDTRALEFILDARDNQDLPFFLILDEMNLSHVERYFADFLSAMESGDEIKLYAGKDRYASNGRLIPQTLEIPKNLFVIGTMNVDETTYMFSPKVLDRAQVIEFRVSKQEMSDFLAKPGNPKLSDLAGKGVEFAKAFLDLADERKTKQPAAPELAEVKTALDAFFPSLAELGAEFGYRTAIEIVTFVAYYLDASGYAKMPVGTNKKTCLTQAIDAAILQKLLPKLHGAINRLGPVLDALVEKSIKKIPQANDPDAEPTIQEIYPLTYEKLKRMKVRLEKNNFTSFAEA